MNTPLAAPQVRAAARPRARFAVLLLAMLALLAGLAGGLVRAGVGLPGAGAAALVHATVWHAALMIGGFFGTVIGIERAVAVKTRSAWLVPLASGLGALGLLLGFTPLGAGLLLAAALGFVALGVQVVRLQRAAHTALLLVGAFAWLAGNIGFALGAAAQGTIALWFAFLIVTIAAERLEMTRLMRRRPGVQPALFAIVAGLLAGALLSFADPRPGGLLYGASLIALAAWLGSFDIARRTIAGHGLARYMALCLLAGYAWLLVGGLAWVATALGQPLRDVALHAVGLGFVVSMVMAHAPVILPAVARIKVRFGAAFYLPLVLLHASLVLRFWPGALHTGMRGLGATLNAVAIGVFALTMVGAGLAARRQARGRPAA